MKDFSQVMAERTDKQLVEILTLKRHEYQPDALVAAEKEFERRQINLNTFYSDDLMTKDKNSIHPNKAHIKFEWYHKVFTFLLPAAIVAVITLVLNSLGQSLLLRFLGFPLIVIIHFVIHARLKETGYSTLANDFLKWITYSLYLYIVLILIAGLMIYFFFM